MGAGATVAFVAAMGWWGQSMPMSGGGELGGLEGEPAPRPGQLLHPLHVQVDLAQPNSGDPAWELDTVTLVLDGEPVLEAQPVAAGGGEAGDGQARDGEGNDVATPALWRGEVSPGPHTLVAMLLYRHRDAPAGHPGGQVQVEQPQRFHARPGRPLALQVTPARPAPPSEPLSRTGSGACLALNAPAAEAGWSSTPRSAADPRSASSACDPR